MHISPGQGACFLSARPLSDEIRHFFDIYKDLEPGKQTSVKGYEGRKAALVEIEASRERFRLNGSSSHIDIEVEP